MPHIAKFVVKGAALDFAHGPLVVQLMSLIIRLMSIVIAAEFRGFCAVMVFTVSGGNPALSAQHLMERF